MANIEINGVATFLVLLKVKSIKKFINSRGYQISNHDSIREGCLKYIKQNPKFAKVLAKSHLWAAGSIEPLISKIISHG